MCGCVTHYPTNGSSFPRIGCSCNNVCWVTRVKVTEEQQPWCQPPIQKGPQSIMSRAQLSILGGKIMQECFHFSNRMKWGRASCYSVAYHQSVITCWAKAGMLFLLVPLCGAKLTGSNAEVFSTHPMKWTQMSTFTKKTVNYSSSPFHTYTLKLARTAAPYSISNSIWAAPRDCIIFPVQLSIQVLQNIISVASQLWCILSHIYFFSLSLAVLHKCYLHLQGSLKPNTRTFALKGIINIPGTGTGLCLEVIRSCLYPALLYLTL